MLNFTNCALRAQRSEILSELAKLQTRLEHVQRQLDSIHYPILNLPPEITAEIFNHSLSDPRPYNSLDTKEPPLLFMHVCRAWREIAISTSVLWTTLGIDVANRLPYFSDLATAWLDRSGQRPISLHIRGPLSSINMFDKLMKTYRRHAEKYQVLDLNLRVEDIEKMGPQCPHFNLLQELTIHLFTEEWNDWDPEQLDDHNPIALFDNAPLLREVSLTAAPPSYISLPYQQLTTFTGELYTVPQCLEALGKMPSLTDCSFAAFELMEEHPPDVVAHPKIQHLTLYETISKSGEFLNSSDILEFVTLRGLQTLTLLHVIVKDQILTSFLTRSSPPLRKFIWDPPQGDMGYPFEILNSMPNLTDLEMHDLKFTAIHTFFTYLTNFLPRLQRLSILHCPGDEEDAAISHVMYIAHAPITARRKVRQDYAQIQSFRATTRHSFQASEKELSPFRKLKAEGMEVYIGTDRESYL